MFKNQKNKIKSNNSFRFMSFESITFLSIHKTLFFVNRWNRFMIIGVINADLKTYKQDLI